MTYILPPTAGPGGVGGYSARAPLPRFHVCYVKHQLYQPFTWTIVKLIKFCAADGRAEPLQIAGSLRLSDCGVLWLLRPRLPRALLLPGTHRQSTLVEVSVIYSLCITSLVSYTLVITRRSQKVSS